ncbi:arylsulfatase [Verrucomicrobiota bacterium]
MPDDRPDILFIMPEQMRGDCMSIDGHPVIRTPNIDAIAAKGVRFTSAYTTCPTCIAARRSLLSGQFPPTHGMVGYRDGIEWDAPQTLPGAFRDAGYQTLHVGRSMHQSPERKRYGYDHMVTGPDYRDWLAKQAPDSGGWMGSGITNNDRTARPWPLPDYMHDTNWTVQQAIDLIHRRDPSCPLFLVVSFIAAHPPLQPPQFYFDRYVRTGVPHPHIGDWEERPANDGLGEDVESGTTCLEGEELLSARAGYYGLINHLDDQIRRLLSPHQTNLNLQNTIVVFATDHGEMLGDHYRWHKIMPYEGAARIPMIISAPPRFGIKPGTVLDEAVCLEDVMPTLLDLAGIDIPDTVEGKSLVPYIRKGTAPGRDYLHIEHSPSHQSLTDGKEKFIWFVGNGREQFFDLRKDPNELNDLIGDPSKQGRIDYWRGALIKELKDRPEGFSDGTRLIPGRPYPAVLPHALPKEEKDRA